MDQNSAMFGYIILILAVWSLPWKAIALWKAARNNHLAWYIVMMVVNTAGLLEILYIYIWGKKKAE